MFDQKIFDRDIQRYLIYLEMERGLARNTVLAYTQELNKYQKYLQDKNIDHLLLTTEQALDFIKSEALKGNSLATQSHLISVLKSFYKVV